MRIDVWHPWGGTQADAFKAITEEFNRKHPNIRVRLLFTPNDLTANQKFFTAVAAKLPPDVILVDGPQVAQWAQQGALEPLSSRIAMAQIEPGDFWEPCWKQCFYENEVWALTYCADPNFAFAWNKNDFREAGLDPERGPSSLEEMDAMAARLVKADGDKLRRIGVIPWGQFGLANSMFTWGWAFGGSFYDEKNRRITADDPKLVKALQWMCEYAKKYDVDRIGILQSGFTAQEQNPFYIGKLSMQCLHISSIKDIEMYAPKSFDYGITFIPGPAGGETHSSWVGGWCMAIPKGCAHPEEAWQYIRWVCASADGSDKVAREASLFPGYRKSLYYTSPHSSAKHYQSFLSILQETRHQRPVMPVQAFYMNALGRAVDMAIHGRMTPAEALREARVDTQRELDRVLAGK